MYQAIVFLPLLGAVLAAIIALAGAHARHEPEQGVGADVDRRPDDGGGWVWRNVHARGRRVVGGLA